MNKNNNKEYLTHLNMCAGCPQESICPNRGEPRVTPDGRLYPSHFNVSLKVYLAGSIFYYGDELRNREWAAKIRAAIPNVDLYSPIENTDINGIEGKKKFAGSEQIEKADNERLDNTDVLIACIDGDILPSGTCAEIGIMREKIRHGEKKHIIGICTDNRECSRTHSQAKDDGGAAGICESQYSYQNLYVVGCIKSSGILVNNIDDAIEYLKKVYEDKNRAYTDSYYEMLNTYYVSNKDKLAFDDWTEGEVNNDRG